MKKASLISGSMLLATIMMTSCGGSSLKENEYLGKVPSMVKNYEKKIEEKEKELKKTPKWKRLLNLEER